MFLIPKVGIWMLYLTLLSTSLLWKTCLNFDIRDQALPIQIIISLSSFRSGIIVEPRYLKESVYVLYVVVSTV